MRRFSYKQHFNQNYALKALFYLYGYMITYPGKGIL